MQGLDPLVTDESPRVLDAREHILPLEPGIPFQDGRDVIPGGEHAEHVLHGEPPPADDRFPTEDGGIHDDPGEEVGIRHSSSLRGDFGSDKRDAAFCGDPMLRGTRRTASCPDVTNPEPKTPATGRGVPATPPPPRTWSRFERDFSKSKRELVTVLLELFPRERLQHLGQRLGGECGDEPCEEMRRSNRSVIIGSAAAIPRACRAAMPTSCGSDQGAEQPGPNRFESPPES